MESLKLMLSDAKREKSSPAQHSGKGSLISCYVLLPLMLILLFSSVFSGLFAEDGYIRIIEIPDSILWNSFDFIPYSITGCLDNAVVAQGIVAFNGDPDVFYAAVLVKLDPLGNTLWIRALNYNGYFHGSVLHFIDIDANDTIKYISWQQKLTVDTNGVVTYTEIDIPLICVNKALRLPNGDIALVGWSPIFDNATQRYRDNVAYFRLNAEGDTLATAYIPPDSLNYYDAVAYDAVLDQDQNVLVTCKLSRYVASVLRLDLDGNIIQRYDLAGESQHNDLSDRPVHISHLSDNDYSTIVYHYEILDQPYPNSYGTMIATLSNSGIEYQSFGNASLMEPTSILEAGESLYCIGSSYTYNGAGILGLHRQDEYVIDWLWSSPSVDFNPFSDDVVTELLSKSSTNCIFALAKNYGDVVIVKLLPTGEVPVADDLQEYESSVISVHPNPVRNSASIGYCIPESGSVILFVYNTRGQKVRELTNTSLAKGSHTVAWDGKDDQQGRVASGIYFIRLESAGQSAVRKVLVLK
jgi:hypothetical protein